MVHSAERPSSQLPGPIPAFAPFLADLARRAGEGVLSDKRRLSGYLRDYFPMEGRRIKIILMAFDDGVPEILKKTRPEVIPLESERQVGRMVSEHGIMPDLARMAVGVWAEALMAKAGITPPPMFPNDGVTVPVTQDPGGGATLPVGAPFNPPITSPGGPTRSDGPLPTQVWNPGQQPTLPVGGPPPGATIPYTPPGGPAATIPLGAQPQNFGPGGYGAPPQQGPGGPNAGALTWGDSVPIGPGGPAGPGPGGPPGYAPPGGAPPPGWTPPPPGWDPSGRPLAGSMPQRPQPGLSGAAKGAIAIALLAVIGVVGYFVWKPAGTTVVVDNPRTDNPRTDNPRTDNPRTDNPRTDNPANSRDLAVLNAETENLARMTPVPFQIDNNGLRFSFGINLEDGVHRYDVDLAIAPNKDIGVAEVKVQAPSRGTQVSQFFGSVTRTFKNDTNAYTFGVHGNWSENPLNVRFLCLRAYAGETKTDVDLRGGQFCLMSNDCSKPTACGKFR